MSISGTLKILAVCATVALSAASTQAGVKHNNYNTHFGGFNFNSFSFGNYNHNNNHGYITGPNGSCLDPKDCFPNLDCEPECPPADCLRDLCEPQCPPPPCVNPCEPQCPPPPCIPLPAAASTSMLTMGLLAVGGLGRKVLKALRA